MKWFQVLGLIGCLALAATAFVGKSEAKPALACNCSVGTITISCSYSTGNCYQFSCVGGCRPSAQNMSQKNNLNGWVGAPSSCDFNKYCAKNPSNPIKVITVPN